MLKPTLISIVAIDGHHERSVLAFAAAAAHRLDPSLGSAILESARERGVDVAATNRLQDTSMTAVVASVNGHTVVVGDAALLSDLGLSIARLGQWPARLRQRGQQLLFVSVDGRIAGVLGVMMPSSVRPIHPHPMEDEMRTIQPASEDSRTATLRLPKAQQAESFELTNGGRFELRIAPVVKQLGGDAVRMLAYNGSVPGPTLRVQQGSEVVVNVVNHGDLEATVHWHGLRLDNRFDGTVATQPPIPVGGSFTYRLSFPDPGIYWYHPHIREDYGQEMGLYGNIVVVPSDPGYWPSVHRELTLTLDDILLEEGAVAPFSAMYPTYTAMGRFGNVLLVNGEPRLSLTAQHEEVVRFYLTNTANTRVFNVALPGARMKLVGGDSGRYERETFVESVVVAPSERVVVDALFDQPGGVALEHRTPGRTYTLAEITVGEERATPALLSEFSNLRIHEDFSLERARLTKYIEADPDKTLALVAQMDMGEAQAASGAAAAFVCPMHPEVTSAQPARCPKCGMKLVPAQLVKATTHGEHDLGHRVADHEADRAATTNNTADYPSGIEWEDDMVEVNRITTPANMRWKLIDRMTGAEGASIDWRFRVGDRVKIRVVNEMDSDHPMHHPFHIHGAGRFLTLSRDGVVEPNLVWKDTVLVPTGQTVDILLDVTHPGVWMAHCHIAEHHESGMMLRFHVDR